MVYLVIDDQKRNDYFQGLRTIKFKNSFYKKALNFVYKMRIMKGKGYSGLPDFY
jgi:hypothetical protein